MPQQFVARVKRIKRPGVNCIVRDGERIELPPAEWLLLEHVRGGVTVVGTSDEGKFALDCRMDDEPSARSAMDDEFELSPKGWVEVPNDELAPFDFARKALGSKRLPEQTD